MLTLIDILQELFWIKDYIPNSTDLPAMMPNMDLKVLLETFIYVPEKVKIMSIMEKYSIKNHVDRKRGRK